MTVGLSTDNEHKLSQTMGIYVLSSQGESLLFPKGNNKMQTVETYADETDAATKVFSLVEMYRERFPESAINDHTLVNYLIKGGAINWFDGSLYCPKFSKPEPEQNVGQEDLYEEQEVYQEINIGELIEAGISFQMRAAEIGFETETLVLFEDDLNGSEVVSLFGELRGVYTVEKPDTEFEISEPMTEREVFQFISSVLEPDCLDEDESCRKAARARAKHTLLNWGETLSIQGVQSQTAKLQIMLTSCVEQYEDSEDKDERLADTYGRAKTTSRRGSIGQSWSYCSTWFIGDRGGVTHGREYENDRTYSKQRQFAQPGERVDGELDFNDLLIEEDRIRYSLMRRVRRNFGPLRGRQLGLALSKLDALFNSCYTHDQVRYNKATGQDEVTHVEASDGGPINRGWTDRSIYLLRQEMRRNEYFAEKLWRFLTWPIKAVEKGLERIEEQYIDSIKACAPGPGRARSAKLSDRQRRDLLKLGWYEAEKLNRQQWVNVPLYGDAAIQWLRVRGQLGNLKGMPVHKNIRVVVGESWHMSLMRREHLEELRDALEWRQLRSSYEGLPVAYVTSRYC